MEDAHVVDLSLGGDTALVYAGVYDGHGGRGAVEYVERALHRELVRELKRTGASDEDVTAAMHRAFKATDNAMAHAVRDDSGSTAVVALLRRVDTSLRKLYVANCGDARAVLGLDAMSGPRLVAKRISFDHKCSDPGEAERVRRSGGFVSQGRGDCPRVNGMLAITRSFGDHSMKSQVVADPFQTVTEVRLDARFLILACDGLWDVVDDQSAVELLQGMTDADAMAAKLVATAMKRGTTDNVTCLVVLL